jgi:outer membrane lipoprotein-sorting protein
MSTRILTVARAAVFGAGLLAALPAAAQQALTASEQAILLRIEGYLNGITTMQARFTQTSDAGSVAEGDFYLSRPGRMRIEYDDPIPYLYVADGFWLTFWDEELRQRSDVLLGTTIADVITRERIRLSGDVTVMDVRQAGGQVEVDLVQTEDPGAGQLTLVFQESPMRLDRWVVRDGQGITTEVRLTDPQYGIQLSSSLFVAPRPDQRRRQ